MSLSTLVTVIAAFNLVCAGTEYSGPVNEVKKSVPSKKQFSTVYRVDLVSSRWCKGECKETKPLYSVSDTHITFERTERPLAIFETVNRESGSYTSIWRSNEYVASLVGTCTREDFTGFPERKF